MNAVTTVRAAEQSVAPWYERSEKALIATLQNSTYPGARPESIITVLEMCRASGKNPFKKPYHIVPMWGVIGYDDKGKERKGMRDVIMPGINDYRTDASRTGVHEGTTEPEFGPMITEKLGGVEITYPEWCRVTVYRLMPSGRVAEFTAKEFWKENYATAGRDTVAPNAMWKKRPSGQLAKCAEAQALRKAFPEELGSLLTFDEMEGKEAIDVYDDGPREGPREGVSRPKAIEKPKVEAKPDPDPKQAEDAEFSEVDQKPQTQQTRERDDRRPGEKKPDQGPVDKKPDQGSQDGPELVSRGTLSVMGKLAEKKKLTQEAVCAEFGIKDITQISAERAAEVLNWIKAQP